VVNSRKSVNFTSANGDRLRVNSGMVFTNSVTAIVFIKPGTQNFPYADILDQDHAMDGYNGWVIQRNNAASQWLVWLANEANTTWLNTNAVSCADNTPQIVTLRKGSSTLTLSSNGTSSGDVAIADQQIRQVGYLGLNIGSWRAGNELFSSSRHYNGEICEIVVYNRALSLTELKQVHTYLGQKWGIVNADKSFIDLKNNSLIGSLSTDAVLNQNQQKSIEFRDTSGNGSYFNFGNLDLNLGSLTIDYWFKLTSDPNIDAGNTYRHMFIKNSSFYNFLEESRVINFTVIKGGVEYRRIGNYNGNIGIFGNGIVAGEDFGMQFVFDQWYNTVFVYDSSNGYGYYYLNGTLLNSGIMRQASSPYTAITAGNIDNSTSGATFSNIDAGATPYFFTGRLASLKLYNKPLSSAEVSSNYETMKNRFVNTIVERGLVLNLDAGNIYSYAGAGTSWYDVSGNSYNGVLTNGPTYSSTNGGIINFDGVDDYSISTVASIPASSTVGIWIKSSNYSNKIPLSIDGDSYASGPNIYFNSSYINWNTGDGALNPFSGSSYPDSNWHYIVVTNDSSTNAKLYIDGVLIGTAAYRSTLSTTSNNFWIGRFHGDNNYTINASIGQVQLYNRVLSAAEVLQNYNATKDRFGL
jgi:hypothetical protein